MVSQYGLLQLLTLAYLASSLPASGDCDYHVVISPQSPVVEIGTNFTATCMLINTTEATADDLYWSTSEATIPKEQYTRINESAVNVTVTITSETPPWIFCKCQKHSSPYVVLHPSKFVHGIRLQSGYPPVKPENLTCMAVQEKSFIAPNINCTWEPGTRESKDVITKYTLIVDVPLGDTHKAEETVKNSKQIIFPNGVFPNHMSFDISVKAENILGKVESEHLIGDTDCFVKTNPPSDVKVISEKHFPTSLLMNWTPPIAKEYVKLMYWIRFCPNGSQMWTYVPLADTAKEIQSFRLQSLQPDTVYVTQLCCKTARVSCYGYWSNWSSNTTARTPESKPTSKPDLWRVITPSDSRKTRRVQVICKVPVLSNGKIRSFDISVRGIMWESIPVNSSESDHNSDQRIDLSHFDLPDWETASIEVTANNSVGKSPQALLVIPKTAYELPPVEGLKLWTHSGQLWLEWQPPNITAGGGARRYNVTEYVVEWDSDWQREHRNTTKTAIRGSLQKFKCYRVSVYSLYSGRIGKPVSVEAYLEEGSPVAGPSVKLNGKPGSSEAEVVWKEIPEEKRRGFIKNYTIFYSTGTKEYSISVSADTYSCLLKPLSSNTKYVVWVKASTIRGSFNGTEHSFSTLKYAPGQIEGIVVGACFGFLFFVLLTVLLCIYKKDSIKRNFWPQIPNPGNSSISTWSPDFPSKTDTTKENALADVSVVEVDVFDGKSVFEEDKASLPLKKDKYLSEEHSSGIGGSSCMSSPRQSVSDSDEGGDSGETTASIVLYSHVVPSNGYKGQTPSSLPQSHQPTFARSESTQPLLDSEENPDMLGQEGSRQSHRFPRNPCFKDGANLADFNQLEMEDQEGLTSLRFCPLEEGSQQTTPPEEGQSSDWQQTAPVPSYMPQLGGYRPQ